MKKYFWAVRALGYSLVAGLIASALVTRVGTGFIFAPVADSEEDGGDTDGESDGEDEDSGSTKSKSKSKKRRSKSKIGTKQGRDQVNSLGFQGHAPGFESGQVENFFNQA